jgi:hypothetical protein
MLPRPTIVAFIITRAATRNINVDACATSRCSTSCATRA